MELASEEKTAPTRGLCRNVFSQSSQLALHRLNSPERSEVEQFIRQQFQRYHQAEVRYFMPLLLSLRCAGKLSAAVGLNSAANAPLFLEQYLSAPIQNILSQHSQRPVARQHILEVGNLVAGRSGTSLLLMVILSELIAASDFRWVVFTATQEVHSLLNKLNYHPITLAPADASKLATSSADWGQYYQRQPQVMAGLALPAIKHAQQLTRYKLIQHLFATELASLNSQFKHEEPYYA